MLQTSDFVGTDAFPLTGRGVMPRASIQTAWAAAMLGCAAVLAGCGGSSPAPTGPTPIAYENVAGTYTGDIDGVSQGVTIDGTLTLNLQQSNGVLSGGGTIVATLGSAPQGGGTVTLAGTVASGPNPAISLTFRSVPCPNLTSDWTGSFASGSGVLTITGAINIANSSCVHVLSFPQTILLKR
jgi:hypothetical protein